MMASLRPEKQNGEALLVVLAALCSASPYLTKGQDP